MGLGRQSPRFYISFHREGSKGPPVSHDMPRVTHSQAATGAGPSSRELPLSALGLYYVLALMATVMWSAPSGHWPHARALWKPSRN